MLGRRSQQDFEQEIRSHLELEIDRLRAQGMSPTDAERAARRTFGNVSMAGDRFRDGQAFAALDNVWRDVRHAWRSLRRTPVFLVTAVITLALGIGVVTGMFDVVNTVVLRPLPYPHADRLVAIQGTAPGSDLPEHFDLGSDFYLQYKEKSQLLDGVFMFGAGTSTFRTPDRVERISMAFPSNDMYATLGVRPEIGRLPTPEDDDNAVLISDQLWSSWFGRDSAVIGKWYFVSDSMKQVIGVMPSSFHFPSDNTMLWVATPVLARLVRPGTLGTPVIARMKEGVTPEQLEAELTGLARELPARFGGPASYEKIIAQHHAVVMPVLDRLVGPTAKTSLWVLLGAVTVVLLIACANVGNLFMVRAESRRRDLTVRRAVGASRAQLMRVMLAEALVVALLAGAIAVPLSTVTLPLVLHAAPEGLARLSQVGLDGTTIGVAFLLVLAVALLCGAIPAIRASAPDLAWLRDGGRGNTGRGHWGRDVLVVGQTALALVLLIASALLARSFERLRDVDPGYDVRDLYTFQYAPQQERLTDGPSLGALHLDVMDRLRALPGVTDVGVINNIPLDETTSGLLVTTDETPSDANGVRLSYNFTGGDYFRAMGISLLRGRAFTNQEALSPNTSVIMSRSAAEKLWPGQDPIGRRVRPRFNAQDTVAFTVVGMVEDVKQNDWREAGEALMYLPLTGPKPFSWVMGSPAYVVKSPRADVIGPEVRRIIHEVAPEAPVYREYTMEFLARRSMLELSFTMLTLGVVSALALVLGAVGLYGVLAYVVAQRTREIGVRMALGATARTVRRQVVSEGARVVLIGIAIGVGAALLCTRYLESLLYGVGAVDPLAFLAMSVMMIATGLLASYVPARRASSVDPMEALRGD